jgi:DNA-binding response OmpR family regulator
LRADPALAAIKMVMLTAKGRETEVAKGLALGADAYITKPFSTKDLVRQGQVILLSGAVNLPCKHAESKCLHACGLVLGLLMTGPFLR